MDKAYFNDNKVSDHHALIPTINQKMPEAYEQLSEQERNVFDEVVVSFLSIFYPPYEYESTEIISTIGRRQFKSSGKTLIASGYKEVHKLLRENANEEKQSDQSIPDLREGMELKLEELSVNEDRTKPPARYNPGNIIKLMGKYRIGTSATSAGIVQNLIKRGFIKLEKNKYISTELGRRLLSLIPNVLKSPEMTIRFEEKLQKVRAREITKQQFIDDIITEIEGNKHDFLKNIPKEKLGGSPSVGACPECGRKIRENQRSWYCEGYNQEPQCSFSIWKEIAGKKITPASAKKLITNKRSDLIKGFTAKSGKSFDAYLVLQEDGTGRLKTAFEFPEKKGDRK